MSEQTAAENTTNSRNKTKKKNPNKSFNIAEAAAETYTLF